MEEQIMAGIHFFDMDDVDLPDTITREIHDHEVLLAFNGDTQAEAFLDWWGEEGLQAFKNFTDKNEEEYI
jgi:hypothetical protein